MACAATNIKIGSYSFVEKGAKIGRNVIIGDYTKISKYSVIGNNVRIGDNCKIGYPDGVDEKARTDQNSYYKRFLVKSKKLTDY